MAHRLSTIIHSDKIVVIADGVIQETGTHTQLIKKGGIYSTLCEGQGLTTKDQYQNQSDVDPITPTVPLTDDALKGIHSSQTVQRVLQNVKIILAGKEVRHGH